MLQFLSTVPRKWRLFWAIESIGISFVLALIAVIYFGAASSLLEGNNGDLREWPTWFTWGLNPLGVTLASILVSSTLEAVCEVWSDEASGGGQEPTPRSVVEMAFVSIFAMFQREKERFIGEPCFYVTRGLWFAQGVVNWLYAQWILGNDAFPTAFNMDRTNAVGHMILTEDIAPLIFMNAVLATGIAAKVFCFVLRRSLAPCFPSEGGGLIEMRDRFGNCRVPSLLVGWGIAYWIISICHVLGASWHGGGWNNAPSVLTLLGYVVLPCIVVAGILMVTDANSLGIRVGAFVRPAVNIMKDRGRVEYWVVATVFRDLLIGWMGLCDGIKYALNE